MQVNYRTTMPLLHYSILVFIYAVAIVTLVSHTVLHAQTKPHSHQASQVVNVCKEQSVQHQLTFTDSGVVPEDLTVKQCDTIIVHNKTSGHIELAIGSHPRHIHYAGFEETTIPQDGMDTFRATQTGTYQVHDHDNPTLKGELTVEK